jgi:predicted nucleic acid-binding protein
VTDHVYFDTSALLRWAFCLGGSPDRRDLSGHATVESLLGSEATLAVSPVTLIEVVSNINSKVRASGEWYGGFDIAKAEKTQGRLMSHIACGRIRGRNLGTRAFEMAMMYVAQITQLANAKLLAWDALHLYEAVRWSLELGDGIVVKIATSDSDFERFLEVLPDFCNHVEILDVCAVDPDECGLGRQGRCG